MTPRAPGAPFTAVKPLLLLFGALCLSSCATGYKAAKTHPLPACRRAYLFWPQSNHTSLLLPKTDFPIKEVVERLSPQPRTGWIEVGFGSLPHYRAIFEGKPRPGPFHIFRRSPGAMGARPFDLGEDPGNWDAADALFPLDLPEEAYGRLLDYIKGSFAGGGEEPPEYLFNLGNQNFYRSSQSYHVFHICHSWALTALRTAGLGVPRSSWSQENTKAEVRYGVQRPRNCATAAPENNILSAGRR